MTPVDQDGDLLQATLPSSQCAACKHQIARREHRVFIRPSWRRERDELCKRCWLMVVEAAGLFIMLQVELPLEY